MFVCMLTWFLVALLLVTALKHGEEEFVATTEGGARMLYGDSKLHLLRAYQVLGLTAGKCDCN